MVFTEVHHSSVLLHVDASIINRVVVTFSQDFEISIRQCLNSGHSVYDWDVVRQLVDDDVTRVKLVIPVSEEENVSSLV